MAEQALKAIKEDIRNLKEGETVYMNCAWKTVQRYRGKYYMNINGYEKVYADLKSLFKALT